MLEGPPIVLLLLTLYGAIASEHACPDLDDTSPITEQYMVWKCELNAWKKELAEWKQIVEQSCVIDQHYHWKSLYKCPDYSEVTCLDKHERHNESDIFNCWDVSCMDGRYSNRRVIHKLWKQHLNTYKKMMDFYKNELRYCIPRNCDREPTPTTYQMDSTFTAASVTTTTNDQTDTITSRSTDTSTFTAEDDTTTYAAEEAETMITTTNMTYDSGDGEWKVFQRRIDGSVDFNRNWTEYVNGFGNSSWEFWLGLEKLHQLTKNGDQELRVDMVTTDGEHIYAEYSSFEILSSIDNYTLIVSGYSGNATDSLTSPNYFTSDRSSNHQRFSTRDVDHDQDSTFHCAQQYKGGWWYNSCFASYLNGEIGSNLWFDQDERSATYLNYSEMKLRRNRIN